MKSKIISNWAMLAVVPLFLSSHGRAQTQSTTTADPAATIQLQFPNNGIGDILGIYELLTGKAVVKESAVFDGKPISLVTAKPITQSEAISLIESCLEVNGYVLVQSKDGRSVRITLGTAAQANITKGLTVSQSLEGLPTGPSMASYFLRLEHLDPSETAVTLWSHLGLHTFGD